MKGLQAFYAMLFEQLENMLDEYEKDHPNEPLTARGFISYLKRELIK